MEVAQKAKIKWAIEGDENILNKKRSQLAIRGILVDGTWIDSPTLVKKEFLSYFSNRFDQPYTSHLLLGSEFPNKLNLEQQMDLETNVTREEIKRAVWDCGVDKSPGSDGFTFGFYQRYWSFLEKYVEEAIFYFVQRGTFPKGGNSSFIALIPKTHNANMVDFEKAYDSVRWDHLDDVLKNFGFGDTWRGWIQSCLKSLRGSVMVNGSPTKKFQFYRGLKQGDPLSPFLFILIMKSLHILVQRVVDAGLRINMNKSKLMGIYVANNKVDQVAAKIGYETQKAPFSYLGLKVGDLMSHIQPWDDMLNKLTARLSKWKMKTLSIGGRLTLLKSVLELNSKKPSWVKWSKVLASKDKGGLGISSLYALNRALLFKWVWRFRTQNSSLWARIIKEIHGQDGKLDNKAKYSHPSIWWDIVREMKHLKNNEKCLMLIWDFPFAETQELRALATFFLPFVRRRIDDSWLQVVSSMARWVIDVPIEINIHAWKVRLDCLPTRLNISKRGMDITSISCPVCGLAVESVFVILCGGRFGTSATRASLVRLFLRRHLYLKIWYLVPFIGLDIDVKRLLVG
ncbi:RNA-directed DNA polymerase, eukaryota [Tanacetum coccineum]